MIRKIILENYMAHSYTVIEPAAGLTVLIGPNNCGKSAVVHALEMICYNSDAAGFAIRHGAKKATVTVETVDEDGTVHTLVWWRKKDTAGYVIDGREISGQGRGKVPDDLHRILRMPEVAPATGDSFRIHFGLQKSPIFLLDDPQSRAAQFFASSSDADRLMEMQRRHTQKVQVARRDRDRLDRDVAGLDDQLGVLAPLPEISKQLTQLETAHARLNAMQMQLAAMGRCIESLERATAHEQSCLMRANALAGLRAMPRIHELAPLQHTVRMIEEIQHRAAMNQARQQVLVELNGVPFLPETSGLVRLIRELQGSRQRFDRDTERVGSLDPLREVPDQHDSVGLRNRIVAIELAHKRQNRLQSRSQRLSKLKSVPDLEDAGSLSRSIGRIEALTGHVRQQKGKLDVLGALPNLPSEINLQPLRELVGRIAKSAAIVDRAQKTLDQAGQKLIQLRAQIDQWVEQNPQCETCGQEISAELIVAGAAGGQGGHRHE